MKTAVALGTFDGVHKGHQAVLNLPKEYKKVAVLFSQPPKMVYEEQKELLTLPEDKIRIIRGLGIDEFYIMQFDEVCNLSPEEFFFFIKEKFSPDLISCGFNYRFGKGAAGNCETLQNFCKRSGIECRCLEPVKVNGQVVSSTYIRSLLKQGRIKEANGFLSEHFGFAGTVIPGDKRGRTIDFPTANLAYPKDLVKVKFGVYKTKVFIENAVYNGITNIGIRPTYPLDYVISETHIKEFSGSLYGKKMRIFLSDFIREEKKFDSIEQLQYQIEEDLKK